MKKHAIAFIALFLCAALFFCLSACNNAENNTRDNEMDEIYIGTPATELSRSEQNFYANYIADYTEFIKASVCENIQKNHPHINWETTVIVDRFYIYDFSQVNPESLTENEKTVFGYIQNEVLTDCRMVVCCEGFWNYYSPNHLFPLSRIILEMFASDDAFTPPPCCWKPFLAPSILLISPKKRVFLTLGANTHSDISRHMKKLFLLYHSTKQ